jgi:hypothetical protein
MKNKRYDRITLIKKYYKDFEKERKNEKENF